MCSVRRLLGILLPLLLAGTPLWAQEPQQVLLLNAYHAGMDWTDGETAGVPEVPDDSRALFLSWYQANRVRVWLGALLAAGVLLALLGWARSFRLERLSDRARSESEGRYRLMLQHSPTGILHYDTRLVITYCNDRIAEILHAPRERLIGLDMHTLKDRRILPALRAPLAGGTGSYEGEYVSTLSGARIWVSLSCAPYVGSSGRGEGGIGIVEDITERHAAVRALAASEAKYRELVENANAIILRMGVDGRVTYFNEFAERFFGYRADEILGRHVVGTIVPERESGTDRDLSELIAAILADPASYEDNENENITRDGRRVYVRWANRVIQDDRGQPTDLLCIGRDVTDLKRSQDALRESEATYRALFEASTDALSIIDPQSGRFVDCNEAAVRLHGTGSREAFIGRTPDQVSPSRQPGGESSATLGRHHIERALRDGRTSFEWTHSRADGTPFQALISLCAIHVKGRPHVLAIGRDISDQKRAEAALLEAKLAAESANRSKSAFLATMSHEIRTPMNGILGMAQLLMEEQVAEAERMEWARTIYNSGQTLLALLNDILDLSKVEAGRIELERLAFAPEQLLRETAALFAESAAGKGLEMVVESDLEAGLRCWSDPLRLRQVVSNLVNNAIKFTDQGGIVLSVETLPGPPERLHFAVADTGIGIPEQSLGSLFQPFSQVDGSITRRFGGTGLGLTITRSLVELMGGEIGVESASDEGSTFWLDIPLERVEAGEESRATERRPASSEARTPAQPARASGRILVAEDLVANQVVIRSLLKRLGYTPVIVGNGREAVAAATGPEAYDLVLMDCQMPEMDGFEAARRIRTWERERDGPRLPILALTAGAFEEDRERCLACGMDDFLAKPVDKDRLAERLRHWRG